MEINLTLSGNDIGIPQEIPVGAPVEDLILTVNREDPGCMEQLQHLSDRLDRIIELLEEEQRYHDRQLLRLDQLSMNALPEEEEPEEEPEINVYVSVSGNTISGNTVSENTLIHTKLKDYSLTDSLLLVIMLILLLGNVLQFMISRKKGD